MRLGRVGRLAAGPLTAVAAGVTAAAAMAAESLGTAAGARDFARLPRTTSPRSTCASTVGLAGATPAPRTDDIVLSEQ